MEYIPEICRNKFILINFDAIRNVNETESACRRRCCVLSIAE
jgi:hypothetical protein